MNNKILISIFLGVFLIGCGGSSSKDIDQIQGITDEKLLSCFAALPTGDEFKTIETFECHDIDLSDADISQLNRLPMLKKVVLNNTNLSTVEGFSTLNNLTYLDLENNYRGNSSTIPSLNLSGISELINLQTLNLSRNYINDLSHLSSLMNIEILFLNEINAGWILEFDLDLVDLTPLSGLTNISTLELKNNYYNYDFDTKSSLSNVHIISNLINLKKLNLSHSFVSSDDLSEISSIQNLKYLDLSGNKYRFYEGGLTTLESIRFLEGLLNLEYLDLSANIPSDVTYDGSYNPYQMDVVSISHLKKLTYLNLSDNKYLKNIGSLSALVNLSELHLKRMGSDFKSYRINGGDVFFEIADFATFISSLSNLRVLDVSENAISDISFVNNTNLMNLNISNNYIKDAFIFNNLDNLEYLNLDNNCFLDITNLNTNAEVIYNGLIQDYCSQL